MWRQRAAISCALLVCAGAMAGGGAKVQSVTAQRVGVRELNPFILTNAISSRLVLEVDWVEGGAPHPEALDGLVRTLHEVCPPDKTIDVRLGEPIPRAAWEAERDVEGGWAHLAAASLDPGPDDRRQSERVHVLYLPRSDPWFQPGLYGRHESGPGAVDTVLIFFEQVRQGSVLWITPRKVEQAILTHEFGHLLGLVANPQHAQRKHPSHCRVAKCVMNQPGAGAKLRNAPAALFAGKVPDDYCKRCRRDLARGAAYWRRRIAAEPDLVERLIAHRSGLDRP